MTDDVAASAERSGRNSPVDGETGRVSVVIPVYNAATTVRPLVEGLEQELAGQCELEVVLVNDGSQDNSDEICRSLASGHSWIRFVNLSRNFGEHNAVLAGLDHCSGDCAVIVDDDFQNPPSEVIKLVRKLQEGYDVVFSRYAVKQHNPLRNLGSRFNNAVASVMLKKDRRLYLSSFKVINRFLIDQILEYRGPYPYVDGLILRVTDNYATQLVEHRPRSQGRSNYTLGKLVNLWMNMLTNFSILPLRIASIVGLTVAVMGFLGAILVVVERLRDPSLPVGWASVAVLVAVLSGVQLFSLGMIGEYLGRLFLKDNGSPMFVVRETMNCDRTEPRTP
jgi:undecaprenyl-phosphate 4-deoxy-4-formamido-L-arabinose transferase